MKKTSLLFLCTLFFFATKAQNAKVIYGEVGGPGLLGSINYDMRLTPQESGLGFRVGIGGVFIPVLVGSAFALPVELNYLIGKDKKNYLELGAGFTYLSISSYNSESDRIRGSFGFGSIGYRYAPAAGGLFFKIAFNPLFGDEFVPFGGVGLGYKF
jgi:hypothetical protein